ncbi:hypothetical protein [Bacillus thuringiensis]|uniref:hypothetical protein n=1 Tax=Bacillus thuringiensis TaxID=1428 RepID=UPI000A37C50F|nr:hypothetical protein [Bacillus thuringiensis]OUA85948.1 hypothetical protein BK706_22145 [Bacillus thuringiensis serovar leesis]
MRSTDVKHSIAGFYYQLLIACYELVAIHDKHDGYVGVECGADIRVNYGNDKFIEAKFYKQNTFSRYQEAIRHTIYNFYHTYKDTTPSDSFHIRTNVPISNADKGFFEQWNQGIFPKPEEYILFIKDCLVYEYIKKDPIKKTFDQFKEEYIKNHPDQKQPKYIQALLKYLHQSPQEYERYIDKTILMSDEEILKFIKKVSFECPNHKIDKYDSVLALKEKTEQRLEVYYPGLSKLEYENIRYLIMDSFLDSTVDINRSIVKVNTISEIVVNQKTAIIKLLENDSLAKTMREIEKELIKYEKMLKRKGHSEKMETILKVVNICTEQ